MQGTTATSTISTGGQTTEKTDTIDAARRADPARRFLRPLRGARRAAAVGGARYRHSGLQRAAACRSPAASANRRPEQIQTTARLIAARRTRVTLALPGAPVEIDDLVRRNRSDDSAERARAVARGRARRHRCGLFADRDDLAAERRTGQHPEQRLLARGNAFEARVGGAASCRRSCSSAPAAPPIVTASRLASRFSANWRARSPTPASSSSATTSAASVKAAAAPNRPACWTTSKTRGRRSRCWSAGRTSIPSASPSSATARAASSR